MMRRADRLFLIVQYLRSRRLTTASWLAEKLEVSLRTVYRDVADLIGSGVPIEGEAGVGYALRESLDLPPLHFTREELLAIDVGLRFAQAYTSQPLSKAGASAMAKIRSTLSAAKIDEIDRHHVYVPLRSDSRQQTLDQLLAGVHGQRKIRLCYRDEAERKTERIIWPLGLFFWGRAWTCLGWCELRWDFRNFRLDRMEELTLLEDAFPNAEGQRLEDYLAELAKQHNKPLAEVDPTRT